MKSIKENLKVFQIQAPYRAYRAGWEVLAEEMTIYFGENCFWLFYKNDEWKIRNAFKICKDKRISSFRYLMGILKNI
jgi:hypothetical protein